MLQECTGTTALELNDSSIATVGDADAVLRRRFPCLEHLTYRVSRNAHFAGRGQALEDGDELALLPPFSGG